MALSAVEEPYSSRQAHGPVNETLAAGNQVLLTINP
ncbi:hypothetical protein MBRA_01255 [Methylobacterium brachiatum]|nr:hypothetical protein MBRA_01255 [Methylobacterium brachiatum]